MGYGRKYQELELLSKILIIVTAFSFMGFMPPDSAGVQCVITTEHEMIPELDTVLVTHFKRVGDKFYVMLKDGTDRWVDDCFKLESKR